MLVKQLRSKGSKPCVDERLSRIICIGEVHFICIGSDLLECSLFILFSCFDVFEGSNSIFVIRR